MIRALLALPLAFAIAACGSQTPAATTTNTLTAPAAPDAAPSSAASAPAPTPSAAPHTLEAATAVAQEAADRWQSNDFAGVCLLFSKRVRSGISQADYVTLSKTCSQVGLPIKVTGVRMDGANAIIRMSVAGGLAQDTRTMVYEDGGWYQEPSEKFAAQLGKPVAEIISADKAAGSCSRRKSQSSEGASE